MRPTIADELKLVDDALLRPVPHRHCRLVVILLLTVRSVHENSILAMLQLSLAEYLDDERCVAKETGYARVFDSYEDFEGLPTFHINL